MKKSEYNNFTIGTEEQREDEYLDELEDDEESSETESSGGLIRYYLLFGAVAIVIVTLGILIFGEIMFKDVGKAKNRDIPSVSYSQTTTTKSENRYYSTQKMGGIYVPTEATTKQGPTVVYESGTTEEYTYEVRLLNPDTPEELAEARRVEASRQAELAQYYNTYSETSYDGQSSSSTDNSDSSATSDDWIEEGTDDIATSNPVGNAFGSAADVLENIMNSITGG